MKNNHNDGGANSSMSADMVPGHKRNPSTLGSLAYQSLKSLPSINRDISESLNNLGKKHLRASLRIEFLQSCVDTEVIPKFLQFSIPNNLQNCKSMIVKTQTSALKKELIKAKINFKEKDESLQNQLNSFVENERSLYESIMKHHLIKLNQNIKIIHKKKLENLISSKSRSIPDGCSSSTTVINLSDHQFSAEELELLNLGFSMTWPKERISIDNEKAQAEAIFSQIICDSPDEGKLNTLKHKFSSTFKSYFSRHKISKYWRSKLKILRQIASHKKLYVSKFDKGNGVVIDNRSTYITKMNELLQNESKFKLYSACARSKKNPFILEEERFTRKLSQLKSKGLISESIFKIVKPIGSQPARLYGLPKIHKNKDDPPYRPILNMIQAYPTNLAKWLDELLKPFIPKENTVKDTFEFIHHLKDQCSTDKNMVSFDVKDLFTNIPVDDTIEHITSVIKETDIPIKKQALRELLHLACRNILFSFNDVLYFQTDGMSMGSCLAPTMAAFAMDLLEKQLKNFKGSAPVFYKRYVDDIFCLFHKNASIDEFHNYMNTLHPNLCFTVETEQDDSLVFLDAMVTKSKDGTFDTAWHLKDTNTGVYIPNSAYSPRRYRLAAVRSLFSRALKIDSNDKNYEKSVGIITDLFLKNGFSDREISQVRQDVEARHVTTSVNSTDQQPVRIINWSFPYIAEGEKSLLRQIRDINKILTHVKIRPVFKTTNTSMFFSNKDKVSPELKSQIVYKYNCEHCGKCYIGCSIRHFVTRQNEHLKGYPVPTEITLHIHPPNKNNFKIIANTYYPRILESIILRKYELNDLINDRGSSINLRLDL